jgi:hypothetical protein
MDADSIVSPQERTNSFRKNELWKVQKNRRILVLEATFDETNFLVDFFPLCNNAMWGIGVSLYVGGRHEKDFA